MYHLDDSCTYLKYSLTVLMEESPQVLRITKEQNKLPKTKSRTKSKKQGAQSTTRDTEIRYLYCPRREGVVFSSVMLIF